MLEDMAPSYQLDGIIIQRHGQYKKRVRSLGLSFAREPRLQALQNEYIAGRRPLCFGDCGTRSKGHSLDEIEVAAVGVLQAGEADCGQDKAGDAHRPGGAQESHRILERNETARDKHDRAPDKVRDGGRHR
jgi:hypothetical protein